MAHACLNLYDLHNIICSKYNYELRSISWNKGESLIITCSMYSLRDKSSLVYHLDMGRNKGSWRLQLDRIRLKIRTEYNSLHALCGSSTPLSLIRHLIELAVSVQKERDGELY